MLPSVSQFNWDKDQQKEKEVVKKFKICVTPNLPAKAQKVE